MSLRVLLDTNIVLDVLLERQPHAGPAAHVLSLVDAGRLEGAVTATAVTTIHYLVQGALGRRRADECVRRLLDMVAVAPVDVHVLLAATRAGFSDYEDAVVHEVALVWRADGIVTRDPGGFRKARLPVFDAHELCSAIVVAEG
jgi:predicted nucleic acid-binding protein